MCLRSTVFHGFKLTNILTPLGWTFSKFAGFVPFFPCILLESHRKGVSDENRYVAPSIRRF